MSRKQSIGVVQLFVTICLLAWVTDVSARPKNRDYLELSLGLLGHGSAADPVGVTLGPGASIAPGGSADQLGFTLGAIVAADRRVQELADGPGFGFLQLFFDLEFMQSRRPTRTDVYFIGGVTGMAAATEETTLQAYGLRAVRFDLFFEAQLKVHFTIF